MLGGSNRCSNACPCDGRRTCGSSGWCQGSARQVQRTGGWTAHGRRPALRWFGIQPWRAGGC
ncbi:hypothetical protein [Myxococcus sp. CA040A]|uniref:hypothetical protein n=1 Tax=Myxococcus sp. CA040A TaxID=2741738 RepID=UPI00352EF1C2